METIQWAQPAHSHFLYQWISLAIYLATSLISAGHALLFKRDARSALCWVIICLSFPYLGPLLYVLLGINRIRTRTQRLGSGVLPVVSAGLDILEVGEARLKVPAHERLAHIGDTLTGRRLTLAGAAQVFFSADECYDAMKACITSSRSRVCLSSYIFSADLAGQSFIEALAKVHQRGVKVQVLIDGVGALYSFPQAKWRLKKAGVPCAAFIPARLWPPSFHINLRNHRKLLIVDESHAFMGGMNIDDRHASTSKKRLWPRRSHLQIQDIHFSFKGPVAQQLQRVFEEDWYFATGEITPERMPINHPVLGAPPGQICRVITDGPNEDLDKLATILSSVIALAEKRVLIMVPYFLPPAALVGSLRAAALRKVEVIIILPAQSNLPFVHWATQHMLWQLLKYGVRVFYQPAPFAHSKLIVIDDHYAQVGSANLDARSLRLNFEIMMELYGGSIIEELVAHFEVVLARSREQTLAVVDARAFPVRLRDALARLFSPYL
jgi:cardiolipin synthase